jgi:hypothetical protein
LAEPGPSDSSHHLFQERKAKRTTTAGDGGMIFEHISDERVGQYSEGRMEEPDLGEVKSTF